MSTVTINTDVEVEISDVIGEIESDDLADELIARGEYADYIDLNDVVASHGHSEVAESIRRDGGWIPGLATDAEILEDLQDNRNMSNFAPAFDDAELLAEIERRGIVPETVLLPLEVLQAFNTIQAFFADAGELDGKRFIIPDM